VVGFVYRGPYHDPCRDLYRGRDRGPCPGLGRDPCRDPYLGHDHGLYPSAGSYPAAETDLDYTAAMILQHRIS